MTRYVHASQWTIDVCPKANPMYESARSRHMTPKEPPEGYPPGDRTKFMSCQACRAIIWGFKMIEEEPY